MKSTENPAGALSQATDFEFIIFAKNIRLRVEDRNSRCKVLKIWQIIQTCFLMTSVLQN